MPSVWRRQSKISSHSHPQGRLAAGPSVSPSLTGRDCRSLRRRRERGGGDRRRRQAVPPRGRGPGEARGGGEVRGGGRRERRVSPSKGRGGHRARPCPPQRGPRSDGGWS